MEIITSQDREAVSACCCGLPECSARMECESLSGTGRVAWVLWTGSLRTYWQTDRDDYADGGFWQKTVSQIFNARFGDDDVSVATTVLTEAEPQTGEVTTTRTPIDVAAARSAAFAALAAGVDWEDEDFTYGNDCGARRRDVEPDSTYDWMFQA